LGGPEDIGPLLTELQADLEREEGEFIKEQLYAHFIKQVKRGVAAGFPEFYKGSLLVSSVEQFAFDASVKVD